MGSSVVPLTEVPGGPAARISAAHGDGPRGRGLAIPDTDFNQGRNRGYAWIRQDSMEGMIGTDPLPHRAGWLGERRQLVQ